MINSSEDILRQQTEEQTKQIQASLGEVKIRGERAFKQFDLTSLSKIPSLQRTDIADTNKPLGLMPVLSLPKPGQMWAEISKSDIDAMFNQKGEKSPFMDYNNPQQVNDLVDVLSNTAQGKGGFIEDLNIPDWAKVLVKLTPVGLADTVYTAFNNMVYDTSGELGGSLIENWLIEPIKQKIEGKISTDQMWKAVGINTLVGLGQSLDIFANPIKGLLKEGPEGFAKAFGFNSSGRVNYDWDVNTGSEFANTVINIALEMVSDPLNWFTFGGKQVITSTVKNMAETSLTKTLVKEGTGEILETTFKELGATTATNVSKEFAIEATELISKGVTKNIDSVFLKSMSQTVEDTTRQVTKKLIEEGFEQSSDLFQKALTKNVNEILQQEIVEKTFKTVQKKLISEGFEITENTRAAILKTIQHITGRSVTLKMTMQVQAALSSRVVKFARTLTGLDDLTTTLATFGANKLVIKGIGSLTRGSVKVLDNLFATINNRSIIRALTDTSEWGQSAQKLLQKGLIPLDKYTELTKQFNDVFTTNVAYLTDTTESAVTRELTGRQIKQLNKLNTNAFLNNANPIAEQMTRQLNADVLNYRNISQIANDSSEATEGWQRYITNRYGLTIGQYAQQVETINKLTGNKWQNQITQMKLRNMARTYEIGLDLQSKKPLVKPLTSAQIKSNKDTLNKLSTEIELVPTSVREITDKVTGVTQERARIKLIKDTEYRYIVNDWVTTEDQLYSDVIKDFKIKNPNIRTSNNTYIREISDSIMSSENFHDMLTIIGSDPRLVLEGFDTEDVRLALIDTLLGLKNIPNSQSNKMLVEQWIAAANEKLFELSKGGKYTDLTVLRDVLEEHINAYRLVDVKGYTDLFKPLTDFTDRGIIYRIDNIMKSPYITNDVGLYDELKNLRLNIIASLDSRYQTDIPMYITRMNDMGRFVDAQILDGMNPISVSAFINRNMIGSGLTTERSISAFYIGQYFNWDENIELDLVGEVRKMNTVAQSASHFKTRIIDDSLIESNSVSIQKTYRNFLEKAKEAAKVHNIYNPFAYLKPNLSNKDAFAILYSIKQNLSGLHEFQSAFKVAKKGQTVLNTLLEDSTPLVYTGIRMDTGYYVQQAINALLSPDTEKATEALNQLSSMSNAESSLSSLEQLFKRVEDMDPMVFENQEQLKLIRKYKTNVQEHYRTNIISRLDKGEITSEDIYGIMQDEAGSHYFTDEHFETAKKMYNGEIKTDAELRSLQSAVDNYNSDRLDFDRIIRQNLTTNKDYTIAKSWLEERDIPENLAEREAMAASQQLNINYLEPATPTNGQKLKELITQREQLTPKDLVEYFKLIDELGDYLDIRDDIPYDLIPNSVRYALQFEELDPRGIGLTFSLNQRADKASLDTFNKQYNLNSAKAYAGLEGTVNTNNKEIVLYLQSIMNAAQTSSRATEKISRETAIEFAIGRLKMGRSSWDELTEEVQERMIRQEMKSVRNVTTNTNDFYTRFKTKAKQGIVLAALTTLKETEYDKVMDLAWRYLERYPAVLEQLYTANYVEQFLLNPASVSVEFNMSNAAVRKKTIADFVTNNWKSKLQNINLKEIGAVRGLKNLPDVARGVEKIDPLDYNKFASTMYERIIANSDFTNASNPFVVKESHSGKFLDISKPNAVADAYAQAVNRGLQEKRLDQAAKRLTQTPEQLAQDIAISGPAIIYSYDDLDQMGRLSQKYFNYRSNKPWVERLTKSGEELRKYGIDFIFDDEQSTVILVGNLNNIWYDGQRNRSLYTNSIGQKIEAIRPDNNYQYTSLGNVDAKLQENLNTSQLDLEYLAGQTLGWGDGVRLDLDFYNILVNGFDEKQTASLIANQTGQGFNTVNYWKGLNDEAKNILIRQGWGKIESGLFVPTGLDNALHYDPHRFNEMLMGSTNSQRRFLPYLSNNPIVTMNKNMQEAAMLAKTQSTYVHNMLDETFSLNKGIYAEYDTNTMFRLLQQHPQMRVVSLVPRKTGRSGFGIREFLIVKPEDLVNAKKLGARIIPSSIYKRLYNTLNNRLGSQGFLKYWNRLMYIYKFGYLGFNIGTASRNYIDTNLKTNIELGWKDANLYRTEAASLLSEFDAISDGIAKTNPNGLLTKQGAKDYFEQGLHRLDANAKYIDYDMYKEMQDFFKYGPISNITEASKRATRQIAQETPDMWQTFVRFSGSWTGALNKTEDINRLAMYLNGLDNGMTREASFERIARTHFDYGFKTKPLQMLETLFPFISYSIRNAEFWLRTISEKPWIMNMLGNVMTPVWNFDEYNPEQLEASWNLQNQILQGNINLFTKPDGKEVTLKVNPSFMDAFQTTVTPVSVLQNRLFTPVSQLIDVMTGATDTNTFITNDYNQFPEYYTVGGNLRKNELMKTLKHYANYIPIVGAIYNNVYAGIDQGVILPSIMSSKQLTPTKSKQYPHYDVIKWIPNRPMNLRKVPSYKQQKYLWNKGNFDAKATQMYRNARISPLGKRVLDPYKASGQNLIKKLYLKPNMVNRVQYNTNVIKKVKKNYSINNYAINRAAFSRY